MPDPIFSKLASVRQSEIGSGIRTKVQKDLVPKSTGRVKIGLASTLVLIPDPYY